jgi:two-component system KDP operon response regulator KdpE
VLIVEDERAVLTRAGHEPHLRGYEVVEADTGSKGLAAAVARPDVILLDLGLPDLTGLEFVRGVRA